ncbi:hypothetical protein MAR_005358 [Mya arenaria]|uniref:Uncharacterized protein n=1 Tax=Mya arenaria TaxID=6604 RepID=A0ABY7EZA9_MYAAR|nr:hypothetical protein MAR_005358 [Mya arenaria]
MFKLVRLHANNTNWTPSGEINDFVAFNDRPETKKQYNQTYGSTDRFSYSSELSLLHRAPCADLWLARVDRNSVCQKHMLGGNAVSRAVKGHILVDSALNSLLVEDLSTGLFRMKTAIVYSESMVQSGSHEMTHELQSSLGSNRTAQPWLQYMDMVAILKRYIKAERTGNLELHLKTIQEMLPFVAAVGHHIYLKLG